MTMSLRQNCHRWKLLQQRDFLQPDTACFDISSSLKLEPTLPPNPRQLAGLVSVSPLPPPPLCCVPVCKVRPSVCSSGRLLVYQLENCLLSWSYLGTWVTQRCDHVKPKNPKWETLKFYTTDKKVDLKKKERAYSGFWNWNKITWTNQKLGYL